MSVERERRPTRPRGEAANEDATVRVSASRLRDYGTAVLAAAGMTTVDAEIAAEAMVWSDLRGTFSHGITSRVPQAVARIRAGGTNPRPSWRVLAESTAFALVDADGGWGQVAGTRAMKMAVAKARVTGVGVTVVRDADVTAAMGWYPMVAMRERMIGMVINNTAPLMAPWGGTGKLLGNQAFAIGAPGGRNGPLLFDSALTAMSTSGIKAARRRGAPIPPGVAVSAAGEPTTDPDEALAGTLLPAGGHRGFGLALMWEVLTGVLSGGSLPPEIGEPHRIEKPMRTSLFCLAVDPTVAMAYEDLVGRIDRLTDRIHASPPVPGGGHPRVPGERGNHLAEEYVRAGIPLVAADLAALQAVGAELGVHWRHAAAQEDRP